MMIITMIYPAADKSHIIYDNDNSDNIDNDNIHNYGYIHKNNVNDDEIRN